MEKYTVLSAFYVIFLMIAVMSSIVVLLHSLFGDESQKDEVGTKICLSIISSIICLALQQFILSNAGK